MRLCPCVRLMCGCVFVCVCVCVCLQVDRLISKFTSVQSQLQKQILAVRSTMQRRDAKPALPGPALGAAAATAAFANMSIAAAGASAGSAGAAAGGAGEVPALGASASPLKAPGKLTQTGSLYRSKVRGHSTHNIAPTFLSCMVML